MVEGVNFEKARSIIINSIDNDSLTQIIADSVQLNIYRIDIPNATQDVLFSDSIYGEESESKSKKAYHGDDADMTSVSGMLEEVKDKLNNFDNSITIDPSKPFYQVDFGIYGNGSRSDYYSGTNSTFYFYLQ